jgi:hypothetical protein
MDRRDGKILISGAQLEPSKVIWMNCREKIAEHTSQLLVQYRSALMANFQAIPQGEQQSSFSFTLSSDIQPTKCQKLFCGTLGSRMNKKCISWSK